MGLLKNNVGTAQTNSKGSSQMCEDDNNYIARYFADLEQEQDTRKYTYNGGSLSQQDLDHLTDKPLPLPRNKRKKKADDDKESEVVTPKPAP